MERADLHLNERCWMVFNDSSRQDALGFQRDGVVSILKDVKTSFKIILGEVAGMLLVVGTKLLKRRAWR